MNQDEVFSTPAKSKKSPPPVLPLTSKTAQIIRKVSQSTITGTRRNSNKSDGDCTIQNTQKNSEKVTPVPKPIIVKEERVSPKNITPDTIEIETQTQLGNTETHTQTTKMTQTADDVYSRVMNSLPEFSGTDSKNPSSDLLDFILRAEWARNNIIEEQNKNIFDQVIQFKLTGDARRKTQNKNIKDFEALKTTLHNLYSTTKSLEELRRDCFTCKQREIETTYEYGQRLLNALAEYTSGFETKYNCKPNAASLKDLTEQAIITFKRGLKNPRLKREIATTKMDSLEDLIKETVTVEKIIADTDEDIYSECIIHHSTAKTTFPVIKPQTKTVIICDYCKKPNHKWKECRTRLTQQSIAMQYKNQPRTFRKYCTYCRREGHDIVECRTKKYNEERQYNRPTPTSPPRNFARQNYTSDRSPQKPQNIRYGQNLPEQPKTCQFCSRPGHTINDCRLRMKSESQNTYTGQRTVNNLEKEFDRMKIFHIDQNTDTEDCNNFTYPENSNGSDENN